MEGWWIEGISRYSTGYVLDTLHKNGNRQQQPLASLAQPHHFGKTSRKRITTNLADWELHPADPFWEALGLTAHKPQARQAVYSLRRYGKNYLIPVSVLIAAMMRPIKAIQNFLFRPQGLDAFSTPLVDAEQPTIGLFLPPSKVFGHSRKLCQGLLAGYSWMHCFPSARAMWDSVYASATEGKLCLDLPLAEITLIFHSAKHGEYQLVSEIVIMSLTAQETPFEFARTHTKEIVFHDSAAIDWNVTHHLMSDIRARDGQWSLSDNEWTQVSQLLPSRYHAKYDLRDLIDLILLKLGTRQPWRKTNFGVMNVAIVQATYQRLQKLGKWHTIEQILAQSRTTQPLELQAIPQ